MAFSRSLAFRRLCAQRLSSRVDFRCCSWRARCVNRRQRRLVSVTPDQIICDIRRAIGFRR